MIITDIKIRKIQEEGRMRAVISVTFDDAFVVHDIKIIEGPDRYFLAMPSRKLPEGGYRDIVHPINAQVRDQMEKEIMAKYLLAMEDWDAAKREKAAEEAAAEAASDEE